MLVILGIRFGTIIYLSETEYSLKFWLGYVKNSLYCCYVVLVLSGVDGLGCVILLYVTLWWSTVCCVALHSFGLCYQAHLGCVVKPMLSSVVSACIRVSATLNSVQSVSCFYVFCFVFAVDAFPVLSSSFFK